MIWHKKFAPIQQWQVLLPFKSLDHNRNLIRLLLSCFCCIFCTCCKRVSFLECWYISAKCHLFQYFRSLRGMQPFPPVLVLSDPYLITNVYSVLQIISLVLPLYIDIYIYTNTHIHHIYTYEHKQTYIPISLHIHLYKKVTIKDKFYKQCKTLWWHSRCLEQLSLCTCIYLHVCHLCMCLYYQFVVKSTEDVLFPFHFTITAIPSSYFTSQ